MLSVPISALEHYVYCPRQCALIHVEQTFDENVYTLRGSRLHERVERGDETVERCVRVIRSMPLVSVRWGIHGKADVIEIRDGDPLPVEYKAGRRPGLPAKVQVCAQLLCLEEMYDRPLERAAVFCGGSRQRFDISIDAELRTKTVQTIEAVRRTLENLAVPDAVDDARCPPCSLFDTCMPGPIAARKRVAALHAALYRPWAVVDRDA